MTSVAVPQDRERSLGVQALYLVISVPFAERSERHSGRSRFVLCQTTTHTAGMSHRMHRRLWKRSPSLHCRSVRRRFQWHESGCADQRDRVDRASIDLPLSRAISGLGVLARSILYAWLAKLVNREANGSRIGAFREGVVPARWPPSAPCRICAIRDEYSQSIARKPKYSRSPGIF
jgi:hypothetical protein